jgi:SAM-dependent methyltransferase
MGKKKQGEEVELLETLGDFTSKENWDKFFTIRGSDDSFEWYAEWGEVGGPLISHLHPQQQILVPGCGNSRLSEHLYDAGFKSITNIDFSKVVISDMLRRNVRERPAMRWRVMDMTNMQLLDESFDVVVDKGGLDALMEPKLGPKLGNQYLSEVLLLLFSLICFAFTNSYLLNLKIYFFFQVKRILKSGGKFICLTLAESHVLGTK